MTTSSTDTRLQLTDEVILSQLGETRFTAAVIERGIPHTFLTHWTTAAASLDAVFPHALTTVRDRRESSALLDLEPLFGPDALAHVRLTGGTVYVSLAGPEPAVLDDLERWLREVLPPARSTEEREVPVSFWSHGSHGPRAFSRRIVVPEWSGIADNYPSAVREQLTRLVTPSFRPAQGGQLLLWYGPPGTGKTYALRALGWEWRRWCSMHYVVDPEVFFGTRAGYMLEVVLDEDDDDDDEGGDGRWRLLVLEEDGRAPGRRRQAADRPGPLAAAQPRGRDGRPGPARPRPRDHERAAPAAASRRLAPGPLCRADRVRALRG